jgi:hypothetical protein
MIENSTLLVNVDSIQEQFDFGTIAAGNLSSTSYNIKEVLKAMDHITSNLPEEGKAEW